jgi:hypothetical protein
MQSRNLKETPEEYDELVRLASAIGALFNDQTVQKNSVN